MLGCHTPVMYLGSEITSLYDVYLDLGQCFENLITFILSITITCIKMCSITFSMGTVFLVLCQL